MLWLRNGSANSVFPLRLSKSCSTHSLPEDSPTGNWSSIFPSRVSCGGHSSSHLSHLCCQGRDGFSIPPPPVLSVIRQVKPQGSSWCERSLSSRGVLAPSSRDWSVLVGHETFPLHSSLFSLPTVLECLSTAETRVVREAEMVFILLESGSHPKHCLFSFHDISARELAHSNGTLHTNFHMWIMSSGPHLDLQGTLVT